MNLALLWVSGFFVAIAAEAQDDGYPWAALIYGIFAATTGLVGLWRSP